MNYTNAITRLQIADLLVNMVEQYTGETLDARAEAFPDSDNEQILKAAQSGIVAGGTDSTQVAAYAVEPFSWALGLNYIQGDGNKIKPVDHATRAEFANILNFFVENNK